MSHLIVSASHLALPCVQRAFDSRICFAGKGSYLCRGIKVTLLRIRLTKACGWGAVQNFQQLYQVQRMVQAASEEPVIVQLPAWIWVYAASAWQDRLFAESNFTPLQQVGAPEQTCYFMPFC